MLAWCYLMIVEGLLAVNGDLGDLDDLGERSSESEESVESHESRDSFGDQIRKQVEASLLPMRGMKLNHRMIDGVGGWTVITFDKPFFAQLLVKNHRPYKCEGTISPDKPVCSGSFVEFQVRAESDYCFSTYYSSVNDFYCITSSARTKLSLSLFTNNRVCATVDNTKALGILQPDYERLCGRKYPWLVTYKYYPDMNSPERVKIPNENPYVTCIESYYGVCIFRGKQGLSGASFA